MGIELKFEGLDKLNAQLRKAASKVPGAKQKFLAQEAEFLLARTKALTPVDSGRLRAAWQRSEPSGDQVEVGNNTEYAAYVEFPCRQFVWGRDTGRIRPGAFMLRDGIDDTARRFPQDAQIIMRNIFG